MTARERKHSENGKMVLELQCLNASEQLMNKGVGIFDVCYPVALTDGLLLTKYKSSEKFVKGLSALEDIPLGLLTLIRKQKGLKSCKYRWVYDH